MCSKKVYIKGAQIDVEEDLFHEFKGHRNFSKEELPMEALINRSRRPISRNLCGFLNNGVGGVVYCGVTDVGKAEGIRLTEYQKDHVLLTLQDLFGRFNPPVGPEMYTCRFIPVVESLDEIPHNNPHLYISEERNEAHFMRQSKYCWCDKDASAQFEMGRMAQPYVIEIEIFPWNPRSKLAVTENTRIQPLFSNEEGLFFIRRWAGLHRPTLQEVIELAESETILYHSSKNRSLNA